MSAEAQVVDPLATEIGAGHRRSGGPKKDRESREVGVVGEASGEDKGGKRWRAGKGSGTRGVERVEVERSNLGEVRGAGSKLEN